MIKELQAAGEVEMGTSFSVERVMYPLINEAAQCFLENVATMTDIDMAMVAGTGMTYEGDRVGPLVIADRIGLDEIVDRLWELKDELGPRFRPARSLRLRVRAGHLGVKTGKGFYEHT
jgi:3-hydroxyacyl-CoA dehydrogenase